jgi:methionyl-tRNA formyltransferase
VRISFLCNDPDHPVNEYLKEWASLQNGTHRVELVQNKSNLSGGDLLFLVSCSEILTCEEREAYRFALVLHASDLPTGRGWSPHIWEIINGRTEITLTLLEATDQIDSGPIWKKVKIQVPKDALWNEINILLFEEEMRLINFAASEIDSIRPTPQNESITPVTYKRRCPEDSEINPAESIASQFDLIRVCDPDRFPAFFRLRGSKYKLTLEKIDD